ncbi:hypothetical protein OPS25_07745 [Alteromonas ponticola]|uniref:SLATT domain-containing protein n=1 Tax=Alteromonas aquimaris TaxID=2998417 RepID=A0ABT3P6I2_9ALTE|nr:hypothetical protein [Alteromonas aquimaris]MCW8108383.1 hypothetical protein [Alteromonas aquimaris]
MEVIDVVENDASVGDKEVVKSLPALKHNIQNHRSLNEQIVDEPKTMSTSNKESQVVAESYSADERLIQSLNEIRDAAIELRKAYISSNPNLINGVSTIPDGSYGLEITAGIIGAIIAAVAVFTSNNIYFSRVNRHNKKPHYASIALKLLENFEGLVTEYWMTERILDKRRKDENSNDMKLQEIRIKSEFVVLRKSVDTFCELLSKNNEKRDKDNLLVNIGTLYDVALGGEFESDNKKVDVNTTQKLSRLIANLKFLLIKYSQQVK